MKAVQIRKFVDDYHEIEISEIPKPEIKHGEVLVQVRAAGVNFVDLLYVSTAPLIDCTIVVDLSFVGTLASSEAGSHGTTCKNARGKHQNNRTLVRPPFTLGLEFAGTIITSIPNCKFAPGDRVFGGGLGSYAQYISVKESSLHLIPPNWSFAHASGLAATAPVSYGALILRGRLKKGETVLIHAAAGGLGLMAVQIAKAVGARVIACAGSAEKLTIAQRFGADEVVNYSGEDWWSKVLEMTNEEGVDVVYDSVGLVDKSLRCVKHCGRILVVGFAGTEGRIERIAMNKVLLKQVQIIGYRFGETERRDPTETLEAWRVLVGMIETGLLKPTVFEKDYKGLESIVTAMEDLAARKVWGKAVVFVEPEEDRPRL